MKFKTDNESYSGFDSGCPTASEYLGYQSNCLENCPFKPKCLFDLRKGRRSIVQRDRDTEIIKLSKEGVSQVKLAVRFSTSTRTIWRVVHGVV